MWRAPVYVRRHTSLPDPKPQSSYFAKKGSRCDFIVWSSFRICKDLGGGRGGGESSLLLLFTQPCFPAPALSSSSSIWKIIIFTIITLLIVVLLERFFWWECWWWLSSPTVQSNHDFWSGYGGILIEMKSQGIGVWRWWVVGVEMMGVFSPQQSLDRVSFLCQGWSLVWGCLSPKYIIIVNVTLLILHSSYSSSSRRVNLNMSKPTTDRLFLSIMKLGRKLMNVQQMDLHEQR